MKCPHCSKSVSLFSKKMNKFGKEKVCPECQKPLQLTVSLKVAAILIIPSIAVALLLKPVFVNVGLSGYLVTGLCTGVLVLLSLRIKAPLAKSEGD